MDSKKRVVCVNVWSRMEEKAKIGHIAAYLGEDSVRLHSLFLPQKAAEEQNVCGICVIIVQLFQLLGEKTCVFAI